MKAYDDSIPHEDCNYLFRKWDKSQKAMKALDEMKVNLAQIESYL